MFADIKLCIHRTVPHNFSVLICWWKCRTVISFNAQRTGKEEHLENIVWRFRVVFSDVRSKIETFGKAVAISSVTEASKWQFSQRCCTNSSHSAVQSYSSFPLHLLISASLFCHGNSLVSCHVPGLAFLFSSVIPLAPEILSPSSPSLWLCKFPWFCRTIPLMYPKDASAEVCAEVWASLLPRGAGCAVLWEPCLASAEVKWAS